MKQNSLELWKQRIADKKASDLNLTEWCKKNNLTKHAYHYWRKRVAVEVQKSNTLMPVFVEVEPEHTALKNVVKPNLQITWNDINLTISDSDTAKLAAEFISQLHKLC